jgi:hypothetical protein
MEFNKGKAMEELYIIKWKVKPVTKDSVIHQSDNAWTKEEANARCLSANLEYKKAEHWIEKLNIDDGI